jgi:hypothetical protein
LQSRGNGSFEVLDVVCLLPRTLFKVVAGDSQLFKFIAQSLTLVGTLAELSFKFRWEFSALTLT